MPIKIMLTDRGAAPVILCDVCGAWIDRADEGMYAWSEQHHESGALHDVAFVHKGDCFASYLAQHGRFHMRYAPRSALALPGSKSRRGLGSRIEDG